MDKKTVAAEFKAYKQSFEWLFEQAEASILRDFRKDGPDEAPEHRRRLDALDLVKQTMRATIATSGASEGVGE